MAITVGASTITMNSGSVLQDPPGGAPSFLCRAFVNFNGTGTVAIRASGNVSSITDNGVGDYTVNFTTAMTDVNYSITGSSTTQRNLIVTSSLVGSCRVGAENYAATLLDTPTANVAIFR